MTITTKPSVLIVDNMPANIQLLAEALKSDYRILVANDGPKALQIAQSDTPPDLILLDIMMPGMDGFEVCQRLKDDDKTHQIPVVFVTAKRAVNDEAYGLNLGAVDYIQKPFALPILRARVRAQVSLKQKTDLLESLALIDGLTGIPNRRKFEQVFQQEWARACREHQGMALVRIEIDHFKHYTERYGHGAGDRCLLQIANGLAASLQRPADLVARYARSGFVMLLPNTDANGGLTLAERARKAVLDLGLTHADSPTAGQVTISCGVASIATASGEHQPLLNATEDALNQARSSGGNRSHRAAGAR